MTTPLSCPLRLFCLSDHFVIKSGNEVLNLNKHDLSLSNVSFQDNTDSSLDNEGETIYGIIGVIFLLRGPYLLVITDREFVGTIQGHEIFRIKSHKIIPFSEHVQLTSQQKFDEERYLQMLQNILSIPSFYFSYSFDLTNSFQRQYESTYSPEKPLWIRVDKRFFWNSYLIDPLKGIPNIDKWLLPIMMGFIEVKEVSIKEKKFTFILISRRNIYRVGTRYYCRGVDLAGNVANNIETEQIVICDDTICSYVQTRGSVPLFWMQYADLNYIPKPKISRTQDSSVGLKKHFDLQESLYGPNIVVCLLNQHGNEGILAKHFEQTLNKIYGDKGTHTYIGFDFHKEVRGMKLEKLQNLLKKLENHIQKQGFFCLKREERISQQHGVIRTNCMDNLDRTNVVQSMIARFVLTNQLRQLGILTNTEEITDYPQSDQIFKEAWAENANAISLQYAGTGAQKIDITRTGKRTFLGLVNDGLNAIQRYYLNNFSDGFKQDAFDLFLGNYQVKRDAPSPFPVPKENDLFKILYFLVPFIIFLIWNSVLSLFGKPVTSQLFIVLCWIGLVGTLMFLVKKFGSKFVDRPHLIPLEEI